MSYGATRVYHDKKGKIEIPKCSAKDCFKMSLNYEPSMKNMANLIDISSNCFQYLKFDCYSAPLFDDGIYYGSWLNKNGEEKTYFHGSNSGKHVCRCGLTDSCTKQADVCNCDANDPTWKVDTGTIKDKSDLPVTGFTYYGLREEKERASIFFGPLVCYGARKFTPGNSCQDLKLQGETLSGFYQVSSGIQPGKGPSFKTVFCDFNQPLESPKIQTEKLPLIQFEAVRDKSGDLGPGVVTYDWNSIPYGSSYINLSKGEFTVPITGTYKIYFQTLTEYGVKNNHIKFEVVGSRLLERVWSDTEIEADLAAYENIHQEMTYKFVKGERIRVLLARGGLVTRNKDYKIRFGGKLLFL